jgi:hypothetical protein
MCQSAIIINTSMLAVVGCKDLYFFTRHWCRCIVRTFPFSHAAGVGALYGPLLLTRHWCRCIVRTFTFSHATDVGALYGPLLFHTPLMSVQCKDLYFFTRHWCRCSVRTFTFSHATDVRALYGPILFHTPQVSVHCTVVNEFEVSKN